jgi:hypothetical protein
MPRTLLTALALILLPLCAAAADNELTEQEKADGWTLMFDGRTPAGWMCGDKQFADFHFKCDFKFDKGCNSGIFLRVAKPGDAGIGRGFEVQVLDSHGKKKPDTEDCGALYLLMAPTKNVVKAAGEWNHCEIICQGPLVKVWLNDEQIIDANLDNWTQPNKNPDGTRHKFKWAFKDSPREGHIALSDHGHNCWYKNIMIKRL